MEQVNRRCALGLCLAVAACSPVRGCVESNFTLAGDSRLPKWYSPSVTARRSEVVLKMVYWTNGDVEFVLKGAGSDDGTLWGHSCWHPRTHYTKQPDGTFRPPGGPEYVIVEVKGVADVAEHEKSDRFRMTSHPEIVHEAEASRRRGECRSSP